jgi:hypothetical protein
MSVTRTYTPPEIVIPEPQLQEFSGNIAASPCMEIMRLAMDKTAAEHGGRLSDHYLDCQNQRHTMDMAIITSALPRGIGMLVDRTSGQVTFHFESRDADRQAAEAICRDVARAYSVIAILRASRRLGYSVDVTEDKATQLGRRVRTIAIRQ